MPSYYAYEDRLASFQAGWPHPTSNARVHPVSLAKAGFYFDPSNDENDNATCYLCNKMLAGWDIQADDPSNEHVDHTIRRNGVKKGCSIAILKAGSKRILQLGLEEGKDLVKMRKATFGKKADKWWPYESKKGWPTADAMSKAGFHLTAEQQGKDDVECCWCNLKLNGWVKGDDPL